MQADFVAQQLAQTFHNRQAQPGAAVIGMAFVQAAEFLEDFLLQGLRNAWPLVVDFDAYIAPLAAAAHHNAPLAGVADGVGDKVLDDAAQQRLERTAVLARFDSHL